MCTEKFEQKVLAKGNEIRDCMQILDIRGYTPYTGTLEAFKRLQEASKIYRVYLNP